MDKTISTDITEDSSAKAVVELLSERQIFLDLEHSNLYYNFPLYRDEEEGGLVTTKILIVSRKRGVFVVGTSNSDTSAVDELEMDGEALDHVFSHVYARLIKNRKLRKSKQDLVLPISAFMYAPNFRRVPSQWNSDDTPLALNDKQVEELITAQEWQTDDELFAETVSTLEGAKGLIRPVKRDVDALPPKSKGRLAAQLESEITSFDRRQKDGSLILFDGPQRIRGLAGSGKTVVLAMKAALIHLREPDARILYTFWTKSLYQHVRRLITRFYRQFDDRDPDWKKLRVMHGWGSSSLPGVYFVAASSAGVDVLNFQEAYRRSPASPFGYACAQLLKTPIKPLYDYVFVDEGQDYPASFIQLCAQLAEDDRFVIAYDELQNIFQTESPSAADIFGIDPEGKPKKEFVADVVLRKCYRNPREVLVCAHALGFGIYSRSIVQMLENRDHWEDIGYNVVEGTFSEGSRTIVERPPENSLASISAQNTIDEIVKTKTFGSLDEEVSWVAESIEKDIADGLRPEDILVITADDRNAKGYLNSVMTDLQEKGIQTHNVHGAYGESDFQEEGRTTLSTVHKAKGNEAFMVYVLGVDALYPNPTVRQRNMLFAAMTRAKGWLRVSGISPSADACVAEIARAKKEFPRLVFTYPGASQMKVMRRDLEESASRRLRAERLIEEVAGEMSPEEIEDLLRKIGSVTSKSRSGNKSKTKQGRKSTP
jgi:superfamily I DNA and RNA helicase